MEDKDHIPEIDLEPSRKRGLIAAALSVGALLLLLAAGLVWYFSGSGEAGKPVPSPSLSAEPSTGAHENFADQTITLTPTEVQNAGFSVETVGEQLASETETVAAAAVVEANGYRQTPALTLVGGIIRRGLPELGQNVRAGQPIAIIFSNELAETQSRYVALRSELDNARRNYERSRKLVEINQPGRGEAEAATRQRKAAEAAVTESRNRFERTTRLITIGAASREELEQDTRRLRTAEAELEEARQREARAMRLLPISPEVLAASEEALNKLRAAETELSATRQRLILYGMPPARVDALRSASQISSELAVLAPASGTVTARAVNNREVVEANKELMKITDLSTVWVIAQVYERDLARIRVGSGASVTSDALPDRLLRGQVTYIDPQLDESTRTGKVRIEIANPGNALKIGMYVKAAFGALGNAEQTSPVVPSGAVQNINNQQAVFIPTSDPNVFALRPVRLGAESQGRYLVLEGLAVGDRVVVNGSFLLRAAWTKAH